MVIAAALAAARALGIAAAAVLRCPYEKGDGMRHLPAWALSFVAALLAGCCSCGSTKPVSLTDQNRAYVALADAAVEGYLRPLNEYLTSHRAESGRERNVSLGDFGRELEMGCSKAGGRGDARPILMVRYSSTRRIQSLGRVEFRVVIYMDNNELTLNRQLLDMLE